MNELLVFLSEIDILTAEIYSNLINIYGESMVRNVLDEMISLPNVNLKKFDYYISRILSYDDVVATDSFLAYSADLKDLPSFTSEENEKRMVELSKIIVNLDEIIKSVDSSISSIWLCDRVCECIKVCSDKDLLKKLKELYDKFIYKRNELVEGNLKLVISFAKFFYKPGTDFNEVIQYGNIGLMRAIEKYNSKYNTTLSTYAYYWIKQVIIREMTNLINPIYIPYHYVSLNMSINKAIRYLRAEYNREPTDKEIVEYLGISLEDLKRVRGLFVSSISLNDCVYYEEDDVTLIDTIVDENSGIEDMYFRKCLSIEVMDYLKKYLTAMEYDIICHRFELDSCEFMTLEQLGLRYGVTRERIRQVENKVKMKIKKSRRLKTYVM